MNAFVQFLRQANRVAQGDGPLRVIGIDLGTTNSTVAEIIWSPSQPEAPQVRCLPIDQETYEGRYTSVLVPSMVARLADRVLVGEGAKRLRANNRSLEQGRDLFWECKNDMGLQRTYHRAPAEFRSAKEIGGKVLRFLMDGAQSSDERPYDRVVVTVPASFQTAQRRDTIEAARIAGLELVGGDLIDEPVAAFLDYGFTHGLEKFGSPGERLNLLVFDFGGGTCDVAILRIRLPQTGEGVEISPLAVSRYHRLGGGDIDAAVIYDVLLPQIRQQNSLGPHELTFEEKKQAIEPAFLGIAEALKISLSKEITRLQKFGKYQDADMEGITVRNPGAHSCQLKDGRKLRLQSPTLSAAQFLELLGPFLDTDTIVTRETEYRMTCSIFAPLSDALDRSRLEPDEIDLCLLVGGSSLILPVQEALAEHFSDARMLIYDDYEATQTAVARGGAYHALLLATTGKGVLQPIAGDAVAIRTDSGMIDLVPAHAPLPYPGEGKRWATMDRLAVPRSARTEPVEVRIELLDSQEALLFSRVWEIPPPVRKGEPLILRYRLDGNQMLEMELSLANGHGEALTTWTVENPLTYVRNPAQARAEIDKLEEDLKNNRIPRADWPTALDQLARLHEELGQRERALDLLKKALRAHGSPSAYLLHRMASVCDELRDYERSERFYREAISLTTNGVASFNFALFLQRRGRVVEAAESIAEALNHEHLPPYFVLQARLADSLKNPALRDTALAEALRLFGDIDTATDRWLVWWYKDAAQMRGDTDGIQRATRRLAKLGGPAKVESGAPLPIDRGTDK